MAFHSFLHAGISGKARSLGMGRAPGGAVCQLTQGLFDIKLADAGVGIYDARVLGLLKGLSRERWLCPVYSKGLVQVRNPEVAKLFKPGEKVCA